jgi:Flp pilus assembly protein TadD
MQRYQRSGDPRHLGRAEAELAAFWESNDAPVPIVVLRAKLRATNHEFDAALADLSFALGREPHDAQALFERATVSAVLGHYERARADCTQLAPLVSELFGAGCSAAIRGVTGDARAAAAELSSALQRSRQPSREDRAWAESLLGELWLRCGDTERAERSLRQALLDAAEDPYTLGTLADLLLDAGRAAEVLPLLEGFERLDGLLLRLTIAERHLNRATFRAHSRELGQRFSDARLRGSALHRREEARFELSVLGNAERALELALANFAVQREPWDVRLVLQAALESEQPQRAREALAFIAQGGLEDPSVRRLVRKLSEAER